MQQHPLRYVRIHHGASPNPSTKLFPTTPETLELAESGACPRRLATACPLGVPLASPRFGFQELGHKPLLD